MIFHGQFKQVGELKEVPSKHVDGGTDQRAECVFEGVGRTGFSVLCVIYNEPAARLRQMWVKNNNSLPYNCVVDLDLRVIEVGGGSVRRLQQLSRVTSWSFVQPSAPSEYK